MNTKIKNEVMEIKHMAFAVEDIEQSLQYYKKFTGEDLIEDKYYAFRGAE